MRIQVVSEDTGLPAATFLWGGGPLPNRARSSTWKVRMLAIKMTLLPPANQTFFFKDLFTDFREEEEERQRRGRGGNSRRLPVGRGAQCGALSRAWDRDLGRNQESVT